MSTSRLEDRVAELETQYAELLKLVKEQPAPGDWRSVLGMFANDPQIEELHREAGQIREGDRAAAQHEGDS